MVAHQPRLAPTAPAAAEGGGRGFFGRQAPTNNRHGALRETIVILFNRDFGRILTNEGSETPQTGDPAMVQKRR
jgi:hypothetical protein